MHQRAAALRADLDLAGGLKVEHQHKGLGYRCAYHQQAVVAQHQVAGAPQVGLQAWLLVVAQRHALVIMVGQRGQHIGGLLADGQDAAGLCAHRNPGAGVGVQDAARVRPSRVDGAVDHKTCRVHGEGRVDNGLAILVDLDQAAGGDFLEQQAVRIDQKVVFRSRHTRADVGVNQVGPAIGGDQAVAGRQIDPQLPLCGADFIFERTDVHAGGSLDTRW